MEIHGCLLSDETSTQSILQLYKEDTRPPSVVSSFSADTWYYSCATASLARKSNECRIEIGFGFVSQY
jgi:hypothetical protein